MGRQVSTPQHAEYVVYRDVSSLVTQDEWEDFLYGITMQAQDFWPSLDTCDVWLDREDRAVLENSFIYFGVSEYCGLCTVWLLAKEDQYGHTHLAQRWIDSIHKRFIDEFGEGLEKIGVMSNGEAVYWNTK